MNDNEVILIGKGIGYGKKAKDYVSSNKVENTFVLRDEHETQLYKQLLQSTSAKLIDLSSEVIAYIQEQFDKPLNEHIHIALTDHIAFLVRRCKMGLPIDNPFICETSVLYPRETAVAEKVIEMLEDHLSITIPKGEVGFITLHIISSISNIGVSDVQRITALITRLTEVIESHIMIPLEKDSLNYARLVTHLRFAIERIERGETVESPGELMDVIQNTYPQCYALAVKLVRILQHELHKKVDKSETFYLALHLYRFGTEW